MIECLARAIVLRRGASGPVLLVCRSVAGGYAYLPGGHVEFDEPAPDALSREVFEETGLVSVIGRCVGVMEARFDQKGRRRHEFSFVFHVEHLAGEAREGPPTRRPPIRVISAEAGIDFGWIALAELPSTDLRPHALRDWIVVHADRLSDPDVQPAMAWIPGA